MTMSGDQQQAALDDRVVALEDRIDHPFADARPGKDRLGEDGAGQQHADLQADGGDDRDQALRSACTPMTRRGDRPLARAVRT